MMFHVIDHDREFGYDMKYLMELGLQDSSNKQSKKYITDGKMTE